MTYKFDPELEEIVALIPDLPLTDIDKARDAMTGLVASFNANLDVSSLIIEDKIIPGYEQSPDVTIRCYTPKNQQENVPALLYIHGGGFMLGDLDSEHAGAVGIATRLDIPVYSVAYRLAPENPYPAGLYDCYATLLWMHEQAKNLNLDVNRIAVSGASAGGGLAAALCLLTRERQGPDICFQCLEIPELDDRLITESMKAFVDTPMWNRPKAEISWQHYLGQQFHPGEKNVPSTAAPSREEDLSNLPSAFITAMEFDPLRDEAIVYAMDLMRDGVSVELHTYPGTFHGSSLVPNAKVSVQADKDKINALRRGMKL